MGAIPMQYNAMKRRIIRVLAVIAVSAACVVAAGCGDAADAGAVTSSSFKYVNPLFTNTSNIEAAVGAKEVDAGATSSSTNTPNFSWPATNQKHVVCAVFNEPIGVKDNTITNTHRVVWMWHSGLPQGREGNVTWSQGVSDPQSLSSPKPLPSGVYYWAVWALNQQGLPVRSSVENKYVVK